MITFEHGVAVSSACWLREGKSERERARERGGVLLLWEGCASKSSYRVSVESELGKRARQREMCKGGESDVEVENSPGRQCCAS